MPNAVQLTIKTDGALKFGTDLKDFISIGEDNFDPFPTTRIRLRLTQARAKIPAFVPIGLYPIDAAIVTLGREDFTFPYGEVTGPPDAPRVEIELRFDVPVLIRRFQLRPDEDISFGRYLGPREAEVRLGQDKSSIIVTVITDRADVLGAAKLIRSPVANRKHRLAVRALTGQAAHLRIDALHTPLQDVLDAVSRAADTPLFAQADAQDADISLYLPDGDLAQFLGSLQSAYGLMVQARDPELGGGFEVSHATINAPTERISLQNLSPDRARLLFPDFLLPFLRADPDTNALEASGPPQLIAKVRRDLALLDLPRPQVRVEAQVWEFASSRDANLSLRLAGIGGSPFAAFDSAAGGATFTLQDAQATAFSANLAALVERGRAKLSAKPFVVVASGESSTLFLGQSRFIVVLQRRGGTQRAQALQLQIGTTLKVRPILGQNGDITLEIAPRVSTIDAVEAGTGLPTLGIREIDTVIRVRAGQSVLIAGLSSQLASQTRQKFAKIVPSGRRAAQNETTLIVLVTARPQ